MSKEDVVKQLKNMSELKPDDENLDIDILKERLMKLERTRHFIFWHDGSTISNHGHLLMMVTCLYDQAIHLNDDQYEKKYGVKCSVQSMVEKPELYLLARCPSNDQQILYCDTRMEDVLDLKTPVTTENGINITDVMRFFKGDGPASQFEAGQQKGHLKNIFAELPIHLNKEERQMFKQYLTSTFDGKDTKRGCDYRIALVKLCILLKNKISPQVYEILITLCEIQRLLYAKEEKRTSSTVLHMNNIIFRHAIALNNFFGGKKLKLSNRKMFGKYYHAIVCHAGDQYRIISGRSSNTEQEERTFNFFKQVSSSTTNHHPDHVILNSMLRFQVKDATLNPYDTVSNDDGEIESLMKNSKLEINSTFFSFAFIEKHPYEYQAHLERIGDFLVLEKVLWKEKDNGVEFYENISSEKLVHHFRSYSIADEKKYVQNCWGNICLPKADVLIPAEKIKIEDNHGKVEIKFLKTLSYFKEKLETQKRNIASDEIRDDNILMNETVSAIPSLHTPYNPKDDKVDHILQEENSFNETTMEQTYSEESSSSQQQCHDMSNEEIIHIKPVSICQSYAPPLSSSTPMVNKYKQRNALSSSSKLIAEVLGVTDDVKEYDKQRKICKSKPTDCSKQQYLKVKAKIEVKLLNKYDQLNKNLTQIEKHVLQDSNTLSVKPDENSPLSSEYKLILRKLKCIRALRTEFNI